MTAVDNSDAEVCYNLEFTLPDYGQLQFIQLFCCHYACNRTFQHFDGMASIGFPNLNNVDQEHIFKIITYDINKEFIIFDFL